MQYGSIWHLQKLLGEEAKPVACAVFWGWNSERRQVLSWSH